MAPHLLDLNDDVLRALCEQTALVHPPHWEFPTHGEHGWHPPHKPSHQYEGDLSERHMCLGWIYWAHVCQRLRGICLATPSLWAQVILAFPSPVASLEYLRRAQNSPLDLCIPPIYQKTTSQNYYSISSKYERRIQLIKTIGGGHHPVRMLETHTDDDRSSDWTVIFDGHRKHEYLKSLTIYHDYDSSRSHLVLDAPNLTHLVLRDTVPSLASPLRLLRVLKIDLGGGGVTLGNDGPVMNILHGTPLLSELDFNFLYRPGVAGPLLESATYSAPVTLNHLQSARITQFARLNNQSMVWPSIRVPESASLRIKMRGAAVDCYVDLVHALSRQLRYEDYHHLDLRLGRNFQIALLSAPGKLNGGPSVFFQHSAGNAIQWDTILGLLPSNMRPELVTSMNVCARMPYDSGSSATALNTFFDAYPAVVTLQLDTDAYVNRNLHRLIAENARAAGAGDKTLLFPVLDTIIISRGAHRILAGVRVNIEGHWNLVIEMLKQRAAIGKRVRRVALVGEWSAGNSAEGAVVLQRIEEHAIGLLAQLVDEVEDRRLSATLDSVV